MVRFAPNDNIATLLVETESSTPGEDRASALIKVLVPNGDGGWAMTASQGMNLGSHRNVFGGITADSMMLVVEDAIRIKALVRLVSSEAGSAMRSVELAHFEHQSADAVTPVEGVAPVVMVPGDLLDLRFQVPESQNRVFDLFVRYKIGPPSTSVHAARAQRAPVLPAAFSLHQNQPNPFGEGTIIKFALPVRSEVAIEVYDAHGRRVRTLARGEWPAGDHSVEWNGRSDRGDRVSPGVYLYRMRAGTFQSSRKLVLLP